MVEALEETDRNPELQKLLHLQKAEKLTDSRLVILKVFSTLFSWGCLSKTQLKAPTQKKRISEVILSSCYLCERKKMKQW